MYINLKMEIFVTLFETTYPTVLIIFFFNEKVHRGAGFKRISDFMINEKSCY